MFAIYALAATAPQFSELPAWESVARVTLVLGTGYALSIALPGTEDLARMLLPTLSVAH